MASMQFCRGWCGAELDIACFRFLAAARNVSLLLSRVCSSNLLYAKEDKQRKKLLYVCRKCEISQEADNPVVYRHEVVRNVTTQLEKIPDAIILDPTLQRDDTACPKCGSHGVVFIQPKEAPGDTRMKIVNICLNTECVFKWE